MGSVETDRSRTDFEFSERKSPTKRPGFCVNHAVLFLPAGNCC